MVNWEDSWLPFTMTFNVMSHALPSNITVLSSDRLGDCMDSARRSGTVYNGCLAMMLSANLEKVAERDQQRKVDQGLCCVCENRGHGVLVAGPSVC